ncbi:MAG TPA: hypothetical protein VK277_00745 [Acidimicrobiales bacterium]|nr:hypothetical protein [Acidimicrobiales bacterium]
MSSGRPLRVLHCLYDVAGNAEGLAEAERELGLESTAVALRANPSGHHIDEVLCGDGTGYVGQERRRFELLVRALRRADVVHFNFGRTIMPPWKGWGSSAAAGRGGPAGRVIDLYLRSLWLKDLPLLKAAGKALFVTYQGDDARQGDYLAAHDRVTPVFDVEPGYYTAADDAAKRRSIATFDRYVDGIFALNPDLLRVLPARARFVPYASVDPRRWTPGPLPGGPVPVLLHAPSHRGVKGTRYLMEAVEGLRAEGVAVELLLVEGVSHADARRLYERADVLVDQLLVGWYGALAVELMALGRPVVCYLRDGDFGPLPAEMRAEIPIVRAEPGDVRAVLRELLTTRRGELAELGRRGRAYVERWHDPQEIAGGLKEAYEAAVDGARHRRAG